MSDWREIVRSTFTSWEALASFLNLDDDARREILKQPSFPLKLPYRLAAKIEKGHINDPILQQFLPHLDEKHETEGFVADPVGDVRFQKTPRLLQKYAARVLLMPTSACAMHCRYCFRQNYPYESTEKGMLAEIEKIKNDPSVEEVILSGGDPLSLPNSSWEALLDSLKSISHIKRLRIHTRFPIGIPERIDKDFIRLIRELPWPLFFVVHCNHPRELDEDIFLAFEKLRREGVVLLNQAVLLKGVNDDETTLLDLCKSLSSRGVLPYYLHQLDKVKGAHRFEVEESRGLQLISYLEKNLPGYAVPKYVREEAGAWSKTALR